jgi:flagellar M-ring protein FliF
MTASLSTRWLQLPMYARVVIGVCVCAIVVALAVISMKRDGESALFARPLLPDQLTDVETHLAAWSIPYVADSDNVRVASKSRNDVLLRLSLAGVPRPHIADSSETLANVGALTPQSVLEAQSRDGLAGDLALGLRGIAGIADATVIIAPASQGYFADEASHQASASVRLTLERGVTLSPETVNGVKTFVAAGVPGLDPGHVAVVDDRGIALSGRASSGDGAAAALQESIQSALDQVLGAGRAIVRAHVELDDRTNVQLETKRTPALGTALSNSSVDERYDNGKKHYAKSQSASDAGSDVVQSETASAPGTVQRVSIAVFLDQSLAAQSARIRSLVETAAGINYARGDTVTVVPIALVPAAAAAPAALAPTAPLRSVLATLLGALPPIIIFLAWLGLLLVLAKPLEAALGPVDNRALTAAQPRAVPVKLDAALGPEAIHDALCGEPPHTAATVIAGLPTPTAAAVLDLYPSEVRREIIGRLGRTRSPLGIDLARDVAGSSARA